MDHSPAHTSGQSNPMGARSCLATYFYFYYYAQAARTVSYQGVRNH